MSKKILLMRLYSLCIIVLNIIFLFSCKSKSYDTYFYNNDYDYPGHELSPDQWKYGRYVPHNGNPSGPLVIGPKTERKQYENDYCRVYSLLAKKRDPSQSEKYDRLIEQERVRLQAARDRRINERTAFLTAFYVDLYSMTQKDFTKKYRWKCTGSIKYAMKGIYEAHHGKRGYAWGIFGDKTIHTEKDISCSQPDNEAFYKDEIAPFARNDNPWYVVQLGENSVKLKLEGTGKHIMITSLINPVLDLTLEDDTTENY